MEMKIKSLVFLLFMWLSISLSFSNLRIPRNIKFPQAQAEWLIRELMLIPGIVEPKEEYDDGPHLVERSINLGIYGEKETIVRLEELGHHARYFHLEHMHDAK